MHTSLAFLRQVQAEIEFFRDSKRERKREAGFKPQEAFPGSARRVCRTMARWRYAVVGITVCAILKPWTFFVLADRLSSFFSQSE